MKYIEAEKKIKALSSKYNVNMADGDFIVNYKNTVSYTHLTLPTKA